MKKYISHVLMVLLYTMGSYAQSMDDAIRYVRPELKGTARYMAMGGAFTALGGDFSAIKDNPASAAVFLNSEVGVSINSINNEINANYFGNNNTVDSRAFDIEQFGFVLVLNDTDDGDFTKIGLAYNYQIEQDFNEKFNAIGVNNNSGLDDYFLFHVFGIDTENLRIRDDEIDRYGEDGAYRYVYDYLGGQYGFSGQQAFLGFQGYMIDENGFDANGNAIHRSFSNPENNPVTHDFFVTHTGKNTKHSFTLSSQYQDKLYIGVNLNSHRSEFTRIDDLLENNYGSGANINDSNFINELYTIGNGFSFQLGTIYKPTKNIRLGLSYQSSTWYEMTDEFKQYMDSSSRNGVNLDPIYFDYNLSTPSQLSGGLAYIFGTKGLISVQYDHVNFQNTSFDIGNGDDNFINQNKKIESTLQAAGTLKVGGEYRMNQLSLRGGYFKQNSFNKLSHDLSNGYSLGLGYDFGGSTLSMALVQQERQRSESLYQEGLTDQFSLKNEQLQFVVSYLLKL